MRKQLHPQDVRKNVLYVDDNGDLFRWTGECWFINGAPTFGIPTPMGEVRPYMEVRNA